MLSPTLSAFLELATNDARGHQGSKQKTFTVALENISPEPITDPLGT